MQTSSSSQAPHRKSAISAKTWFLFLFIISLLTMATHLYLTNQHYQLKLGSASGPAICNLSATFNCDSVAASRYAHIWSIPVALLGLITQIVFFILLISARYELNQSPEWLRRILLWLAAFTFAVSIIMGSISSFWLGTYCLFCMAAYALSLLQLVGTWQIQTTRPLQTLSEDLNHLFGQARWVLILIILIPASAWIVNNMTLSSSGFGKLDQMIQDSLADWEASAPQSFQLDRGLSQGSEASQPTMTIVEFADFLCPHCKMASAPLEAFTQAHPDVKLNFKVFTLDGSCNKAIPNRGNGVRCKLGAGVICAEQISKLGWKAHHWIFERQEELAQTSDAKPMLEKMSKDLGLNFENMETCINSDSSQDMLEAMAQEGATAKIQGTPTVFVNGKLLPRGQFLPVLEAVYMKLKK